jgi:hypothetical protein
MGAGDAKSLELESKNPRNSPSSLIDRVALRAAKG